MGHARVPRGTKAKRRRQQKLADSTSTLERLVTRLNAFAPRGEPPLTSSREREAREVERILESLPRRLEYWKLPRGVVDRFNRLARKAPVILFLSDGTEFRGVPMIGYLNGNGLVLGALWDALQHPHIKRVKRCSRCQKWFVDRTRNNGAKRCSLACTWRWWNRTRRRNRRSKRQRH